MELTEDEELKWNTQWGSDVNIVDEEFRRRVQEKMHQDNTALVGTTTVSKCLN